jgi:hypothetical protein
LLYRAPIESLGGTLLNAFFAEDSYDVLALAEFPDGVSLNDISIAFHAGGAVAAMHSSVLLTASQLSELRAPRCTYAALPVAPDGQPDGIVADRNRPFEAWRKSKDRRATVSGSYPTQPEWLANLCGGLLC